MKTSRKRVLVVDDEADIREILKYNLENEGYDVDAVDSSEHAIEILKNDYAVILLDVMLEGASGFKFAKHLREIGDNVPIIFITAKDSEADLLMGFSIGGDDYIPKPFSIKEIIARVKSVTKRSDLSQEKDKEILKIGELLVDIKANSIKICDQRVDLTKTEYCIFSLLIENIGKTFSRSEILENVWEDNKDVVERTVDVHITRLRKKLKEYGTCIVNKTGWGYCFNYEA